MKKRLRQMAVAVQETTEDINNLQQRCAKAGGMHPQEQEAARDVRRLKDESAATAEEVLATKINLLSSKQLAVKHYFQAAKRKSPCGMQYDKEWMQECILLKLKSLKLY